MVISEEYKEYQGYMKRVTDSFVAMQADDFEGVHGLDGIVCYDTVEWDGGLSWTRVVNGQWFINGLTKEQAKKHNAEIAKQYLIKNTLTFEEWKKKKS
jgi:hypothetical protein